MEECSPKETFPNLNVNYSMVVEYKSFALLFLLELMKPIPKTGI
jgi:hypothetical protein